MSNAFSPLNDINVSFSDYVRTHMTSMEEHMVKGVPDYAFALDNELRTNLMKIPRFYSTSKKIMSSYVSQQIQILNQEGLAVGTNQYPEIYRMGADCAQTLGIGVPNIFILNRPDEMNAYTLAMDDVSPIVVLHSCIIERLTPGELKAVIAHECGHIHNNHSVLKSVVDVILKMFSSGLGGKIGLILSVANVALMQYWVRASEITADRASMICADNIQDVISMDTKLLTGGMIGKDYTVNLEALREQLETTLNNPSKVYEILYNHPSSVRRVFANMEFAECETFYKWRPELKHHDSIVRSQKETDERCRKLTNIFMNK